MPNFFYEVHFYLFGLLAIASSIAFVTRKSPVAAALWLVNTMFCLAALYAMLEAHFIGVIQVLVYAGAIMVVFLFVVMLLNLGQPSDMVDMRGKWGRLAAGLLGLALLAQVMVLAGRKLPEPFTPGGGYDPIAVRDLGAVGSIAQPLFNEYLLAFELTSILLLVAIVGAVVIGRRRRVDAR
ncbi:MAG TPA: NADH-quinone oxidoreductase subunit J [Gemmatimonadaceae bacterium]|nr:NADH-quinone oxidoreductase subunit J [Gemmatimonadaceae bacterium]